MFNPRQIASQLVGVIDWQNEVSGFCRCPGEAMHTSRTGNRDENANREIAGLMNEFEGLAQKTGAAVVVAHHFAMGDSTAKSAMDRMSGAGAWARDPDSIVVLTPHEEENCFTVTSILRNLPQLPEFVVEWAYPLMRVASDLNPEALRRPQAKNKVCSDREFVDLAVGHQGRSFTRVIREAQSQLAMSRRTGMNYLKRLTEAGLIVKSGGLYWRRESAEGQEGQHPLKSKCTN